jgi:hypothetical protein
MYTPTLKLLYLLFLINVFLWLEEYTAIFGWTYHTLFSTCNHTQIYTRHVCYVLNLCLRWTYFIERKGIYTAFQKRVYTAFQEKVYTAFEKKVYTAFEKRYILLLKRMSIYLFGIRIIISIYVLSGNFSPSQEKNRNILLLMLISIYSFWGKTVYTLYKKNVAHVTKQFKLVITKLVLIRYL